MRINQRQRRNRKRRAVDRKFKRFSTGLKGKASRLGINQGYTKGRFL